MNIGILLIELLILTVAFSAEVIISITKNPEAWVADYPPEIQEEYYKTHENKREKLKKGTVVRKVIAIVAALFLFAWMAHVAGAQGFIAGTLTAFLYMVWIGAYDAFFMDWVLFPRVKRWRLPGTEHMDKEYHQKWFHVKAEFKVLPMGVAFALLCGLVQIWIF